LLRIIYTISEPKPYFARPGFRGRSKLPGLTNSDFLLLFSFLNSSAVNYRTIHTLIVWKNHHHSKVISRYSIFQYDL